MTEVNVLAVAEIFYQPHGDRVQPSWDKKISKQDNSLNEISGGWITPRIFYDGTKSTNSNDIYDYFGWNKLNRFDQTHGIIQHN